MTTILFTYGLAFLLAMVFVPLAGKLGRHWGAMDYPGGRKQHAKPVPRTGGAGIVAAFCFALIATRILDTQISQMLVINWPTFWLFAGASLCAGVGFVDDFHRLGPKVKFTVQIIAATMAFGGGIRIEALNFFGIVIQFGVFDYFFTVFWFLLFINAINLVDGLDGLAAGVVSFVCAVMVILSIMQESYRTTVLFAALGGALLGFLRYNYNPATIFLGDGGSYFLGYMVAGLAIMGSVKSQVGAALTIPVLALGVPLFDTLLSPLRRFVRGRKPFRPDSGHVHHKLVGMGFTSKRAVLIIYMITATLSAVAVVTANVRDERAGLFLILLGAGAVYFIRKLGYLGSIRSNQILNWLKDLSDEAGISRERRGFIDVQIEMARSADLSQLWQNCVGALDLLELDMAELHLNGLKNELDPHLPTFWSREGFIPEEALCKECQLKIELPLIDEKIGHLGTLWLVKDLREGTISHFTLKRIEHLRRTLNHVLKRLVDEKR